MDKEEPMYLQSEFFEGIALGTGDTVAATRLVLSSQQVRDGLIKQVGYRNFSVLIALAAYVNKDNLSFPDIDTLVKITGLGRTTVIKAIAELTEVRVGGHSIIKKSQVKTNTGHMKSIYHFTAEVDPVDGMEAVETGMTAKDYILLFAKYYKETFEVDCKILWPRDTKFMKSLMVTYPGSQLAEIIRIAVTQYSKFSGNPKYPAPTISAMNSWLAERAALELKKEQKQEQAMQARIAVAEQVEQQYNPIDALDL